MNVLGGLDESYDNVFSTLTKRMISEVVAVDVAKAFLMSHESRLEKRKHVLTSLLPSVNFFVKIDTHQGDHKLFDNDFM